MLRVEREPALMHFRRAEAYSQQPFVDHSMGPVVTGGVVIGIRCKEGVVLAADCRVYMGELKVNAFNSTP